MEHISFDRKTRRYVEEEEPAEPGLAPLTRIAEMVRKLRKERGWSAEQLAQEMTHHGIPWERMVVTKLELGKRQTITVEEWLTLAYVLDIAPVHLLVPYEAEDVSYQAVPAGVPFPSELVREWVRGEAVLGEVDVTKYGSLVPTAWKGPNSHGLLRSVVAEALLTEVFPDKGFARPSHGPVAGLGRLHVEPNDPLAGVVWTEDSRDGR